MTRKQILEKAIDCVTGQREQDYGSPENSFHNIAVLWSVYTDVSITPEDVAMMMILLKVARAMNGQPINDNFIDIAGYAACAGEIAASNIPFTTDTN